jgi:hypothetical protein
VEPSSQPGDMTSVQAQTILQLPRRTARRSGSSADVVSTADIVPTT